MSLTWSVPLLRAGNERSEKALQSSSNHSLIRVCLRSWREIDIKNGTASTGGGSAREPRGEKFIFTFTYRDTIMAMETDRLISLTDFVSEQWNYIFQDNSDPRIEKWPLMSSPWPTFLISLFYTYCSLWLGPNFMQGRKPLQLKNVITAYNAFQVTFSFNICVMCVRGGWFTGYNFFCQPVEFGTARADMMTSMMWWFLFSKFVDFFDTVFFISRKKFNQISFLHILHHGFVPFGAWYTTKFMPGGHITFVAFLNSLVHSVMYSYYFLSGLGPHMQKYLWWKKYLTMMQMIQFVLLVTHQSFLLFNDCNYPRFHCYWGIGFGSLIFLLFLNFYRGCYNNQSTKKAIISSDGLVDSCNNSVIKNKYHIKLTYQSATPDAAEEESVAYRLSNGYGKGNFLNGKHK